VGEPGKHHTLHDSIIMKGPEENPGGDLVCRTPTALTKL